MAGLLSADVKQLDNINESLLSEIDQLKREIDNTTAKIQEASTVINNNNNNNNNNNKIIIIIIIIKSFYLFLEVV